MNPAGQLVLSGHGVSPWGVERLRGRTTPWDGCTPARAREQAFRRGPWAARPVLPASRALAAAGDGHVVEAADAQRPGQRLGLVEGAVYQAHLRRALGQRP